MSKKYKYDKGYNNKVPAQVVGEFVEDFFLKHNRLMTPDDYVKAAIPKDSPLHDSITHDGKKALLLYRKTEARAVLNHLVEVQIVVTALPNPGPREVEISVCQYVKEKTDGGYATTDAVLQRDDYARQVMDTKLRYVESGVNSCRAFPLLEKFCDQAKGLIDETRASVLA